MLLHVAQLPLAQAKELAVAHLAARQAVAEEDEARGRRSGTFLGRGGGGRAALRAVASGSGGPLLRGRRRRFRFVVDARAASGL